MIYSEFHQYARTMRHSQEMVCPFQELQRGASILVSFPLGETLNNYLQGYTRHLVLQICIIYLLQFSLAESVIIMLEDY